MKEYQKAVQWFELTLDHTSSALNEMWEPTLVNLGHALRKLKEYQKAVSYYEKALTFPTKSLSAFAGLAYTYHLMSVKDHIASSIWTDLRSIDIHLMNA
ncbi:anaphase-promoting complex subunit 6-like isoform X3 [Phragmites australis]|uniref:anaphase-promoting complex subunit 6-like isoform X3 n=1 Tax=Phragmites australis TaxID=29695 RepID=UPI002D771107|nr:anaphase-promoting complex subunit 6-like isoform X3 [Phragmites australis]